jgi:hypothetical protein
MNKSGVRVCTALLLAVTMGCSGTMNGVVRRDAQRIEIMYTDSRVAVAELIAVLPNGEQFRGKAEKLDRAQEMLETGSMKTGDVAAHFEALQTFPGNAKATLTGSGGQTIKCRFKLTDVIIGFSAGGFGICQVSDGGVIDVFF